jgi:hypothetical protein
MKLYRFNLKSKKTLLRAIDYVARETSTLIERTIGRELPITYLTIFAHREEEYERLIGFATELGKSEETKNGLRFNLYKPIRTRAGMLKRIRIRKPDPYRTQVGCADYDVGDYTDFRDKYLATRPYNVRLIERDGHSMLEFHDPDFDVFAYVFSVSDRPL